VQFFHASIDPAVDTVDVYVDDALTLDDFAYRTGSPFLDVAADQVVSVAIADGGSSSAAEALATFDLQFTGGGTYHVIAAGVIDTTNYAPNPDGADISLQLFVDDGAAESWSQSGFGTRIFHGATDLPSVDYIGTRLDNGGSFRIFSDVGYGSYTTPYLNQNPGSGDALGSLTLVDDNENFLYSFRTDFSPVYGEVVFQIVTGRSGDDLQITLLLADGSVHPSGTVTDSESGPELPAELVLTGNYPNPFVRSTKIQFDLQTAATIRLVAHDALGRVVETLASGHYPAGSHEVSWDASRLPSGMFFVTMEVGSTVQTRAMLLLK